MILVIDDERTFNTNYEQIVYARSSREGMSELALAWTNFSLYYGEKVQLWLDHDLGENDTIIPVVDFLYVAANSEAANSLTPLTKVIDNIFVHSQNPTAADKIIGVLDGFYKIRRVSLPKLV